MRPFITSQLNRLSQGKITGQTNHGLQQLLSRDTVGVSTKAIADAVLYPEKVI